MDLPREAIGPEVSNYFSRGPYQYCKFGNFREGLIFANSVKRHICDIKKSRLEHDLPTSVNDRVISKFREGFTFPKLRNREVSRK